MEIELDQVTNTPCAKCGQRFECGSKAGKGTCWCTELPVVSKELLAQYNGCFCRKCLTEIAKEANLL